MGFGEAIASGWSNWNDFRGRARRSAYWFWQLFIWLSVFAIALIAVIAFQVTRDPTISRICVGVGLVFYVVAWLPNLALLVRRMHDIGITGWILLIALIPYLGALVLFVLTVIPGTRGTNRYGPDSRESVSAADVFT